MFLLFNLSLIQTSHTVHNLVGATSSPSQLPQQTKLQSKLGGIPWGVPAGRWPKCKDCHQSMSLLAQFAHHPKVLDLGREGRVLQVFMCNQPGTHLCETWDPIAGANACFILEPEELEQTLSHVPDDIQSIEPESRIIGWEIYDDDISVEQSRAFYKYDDYFGLEDKILESISEATRLGSVPFWIQGPDQSLPIDMYRFVGQLSSDTGEYFGDNGTGYIFLDCSAPLPKGYLFWQCY